jgi:hypothetical protein
MTAQWYYGRGTDITGPVSGKALFDLAASGRVLPTDTVWRDGSEAGVAAGKVKNLFPSVVPPPGQGGVNGEFAGTEEVKLVALDQSPNLGGPASEVVAEPVAAVAAPAEAAPAAAPRSAPARTGRATAGKGAVLIGQDGKTVKFRAKCTTCGREDSSWKSIAIPRGTARSSFFCAKCRKRQEVEIHGIV